MRIIVWPSRNRVPVFDWKRKGGYRAGDLTQWGREEFVCVNTYIGEAVWQDPNHSSLWAKVLRP